MRAPVADDEPPVAGHVVGVVVRLEHVLDAHAQVAGEPQVLVDVQPRVDHRRHAGVLVADQVARAAEVVVGELAEDHGSPIIATSQPSQTGRVSLSRP